MQGSDLRHFNILIQVSCAHFLSRLPSACLVDTALFVINSRSRGSVPVAMNHVRAWNRLEVSDWHTRDKKVPLFFGRRYLETFRICPHPPANKARWHLQISPGHFVAHPNLFRYY